MYAHFICDNGNLFFVVWRSIVNEKLLRRKVNIIFARGETTVPCSALVTILQKGCRFVVMEKLVRD